jgi:hypothetical protein
MGELLTHLCVFALDEANGAPIRRLPFYAEIAVQSVQHPPDVQVDGRFVELVEMALRQKDNACFADQACRNRVRDIVMQAIAQILSERERDDLNRDADRARAFFGRVLKRTRDAAGGGALSTVDDDRLWRLVFDSTRAEAQRQQMDVLPARDLPVVRWAHPLGILATDHAGYLSYDLGRVPPGILEKVKTAIATRRADPAATLQASVWLFPLTGTAQPIDAIAQGRFADDAILARIPMSKPFIPAIVANAGFLAMQNPDLTDWRLSPSSFASTPGALVGVDGCETLLPANVAIQEFRFFQVVRLADPVVQPPLPDRLRDQVRLGYVHEFRQTWYPLGHSLGQILYSLPLAPGESVNLAVVDWSRVDDATRTEDSKLDERLVHNEHRERTISETVNAALHEYQHGSSFMGGGATSAGASGSTGTLGVAIGSAYSLGGATSSSDGSRDLAASTVQNLSDNVSQASAAMREFQSTVVVHSTQAEHEAIETRTVVNYNHSHTLTVLYYEVLRHFRMVTRRSGLYPVVLVKMPPLTWGAFTATQLLGLRYLVEPMLLDARLASSFDALSKVALGEEKLKRETNKWAATTQTIDPGAKSFIKLVAQFTTTDDDTSEPVFVALVLHDGRQFEFQCDGAGDEGTSPEFEKPLPVPINWNQIKGIEVKLKDINDGTDWEETNILITMVTAANERVSILADSNRRKIDDDNGSTGLMPTVQPPSATTTTVGPKPQRADFVSAEDDLTVSGLLAHVEANRGFYQRVIALNQNVVDQARQLDSMKISGNASLLDQVENRALEVFGDYVVFRCTSDQWCDLVRNRMERALQDLPPDERLVTLPTRGVFADAKLGHCNVSEEIDNTRFWDWQSSPIPPLAPEIAPVQPVTPSPQSQPGLTPTPFPASLVNIVNPPAAPDPTGLGPALSAITTPNIFRDMSGRAEVADLLKRLSDNTIGIAEAANRASQIRAQYGGGGSGQGSLGGGTSIGMGGPRAMPSQPSAVNRDLHDRMNLIDNAVQKGLMTPEAGSSAMEAAMMDASPSMQLVGDKYVRPAYTPSELAGIIGETIAEDALRAQGHVVFSDWRKHISATGFDMASYNPAGDGELWIVDNKAQFSGIGNANALTGDAYAKYKADLRTFLEKTWPSKAEADLAIKALDEGRIKLVVSNGFAGEAIRFTKGLFDRGLHAFDVRLAKLFSSQAEWELAYKALTLRKAARVTGKSAAVYEGMLLCLAVVEGMGWLLKSGSTFKAIVGEVAANVALDVIISKLPGGFFASLVIGLESDESPDQRAARKLEEQVDTLLSSLPDVDAMSTADLKTTRDTLKGMIQNAMVINLKQPAPSPGIKWPGFKYSVQPDFT